VTAWTPQRGPQTRFVESEVFEVVYGGARGGGNTDGVLGEFAMHAARHGEAGKGTSGPSGVIDYYRVALPVR
jgi:hypothetical protein